MSRRKQVVPLCPACGWIGPRQNHARGWPPKCGNAECSGGWSTDWLRVAALAAHLDQARREAARWTRALAFAEEAVRA